MGRISDDLGHSCISREEALQTPKESWCRPPGRSPPCGSRSSLFPQQQKCRQAGCFCPGKPRNRPSTRLSLGPVAQAPLPGTHQQVRLPEGRLVLSRDCVVWTQPRPREHVLQVGSGRNTPETRVPKGWSCQQAGPAKASGLMLTLLQTVSAARRKLNVYGLLLFLRYCAGRYGYNSEQ